MTLISSQARKQGIYKNYIHAAVDGLGTIPVTNEAYDVIVCSNGFAPGEETLCYEDGAKVSTRMKVVSILFCLNYAQIYQFALYNVLRCTISNQAKSTPLRSLKCSVWFVQEATSSLP